MPIYSYRCDHCGHQQDVLQKMSDPLLVTCPACHQPAYRKQVTAAGFQLKGSGWYVTDFRNPAAKEGGKNTAKTGPDTAADATSGGGATESSVTPDASPAAKPAAASESKSSSEAAPAKPSGGTGGTG